MIKQQNLILLMLIIYINKKLLKIIIWLAIRTYFDWLYKLELRSSERRAKRGVWSTKCDTWAKRTFNMLERSERVEHEVRPKLFWGERSELSYEIERTSVASWIPKRSGDTIHKCERLHCTASHQLVCSNLILQNLLFLSFLHLLP